jgi:formylglycine-generating enzyme required for sulfatase activity
MNKKILILILIIIGLTCVIVISLMKINSYTHPPITIVTKKNPRDGADMVWVPAGSFMMGSPETRRKVTLDGFWIYKYEVTVKQFRNYCIKNKYHYDWKKNQPSYGWHDDNPMTNINWDEEDAYAKWAGGSLPTGAQWEKAARGDDERKFPWGDGWDSEASNDGDYYSNYNLYHNPRIIATPKPVGSFPKDISPYGVMDMAGNVFEDTADAYIGDVKLYAKIMSGENPHLPVKPETDEVCFRGGNYYYISFNLTWTGGTTYDPSSYLYDLGTRHFGDDMSGFRCVVP